MNTKITELSCYQLDSFRYLGSALGSFAALSMPGIYPTELFNCGINPRGTQQPLLGCVITRPSGSQLAIETVFYDPKDSCDNGDLHMVNFESKEITSYYGGWGTWSNYYGDKHWENKSYLRNTLLK